MKNERNQTALVPYTFDNRRPVKRGRRQNELPMFRIGQRKPTGQAAHGGGGPENAGMKNDMQAGNSFYQAQPSWNLFEDDFVGPARRPTTAVTAGGGHPSNPSNNFRALGDHFGGRQ